MIAPVAELRRFVRAALIERARPAPPPPDARELRRRRMAAAATILVGGVLLTLTVRADPASVQFFLLGLALAATWLIGALCSGPLHLGRARTRDGGQSRAIVQSLALAIALVGVFLAGAVLVGQVPALREPVDDLLEHGSGGPLILVVLVTVVNGLVEELFFRGALVSAVGGGYRAVVLTTLLYALTTVFSGVPLLVFAAVVLGAVTGLQRRVTGGVLGPMITHLTWSVSMLLLLPPVLDLAR